MLTNLQQRWLPSLPPASVVSMGVDAAIIRAPASSVSITGRVARALRGQACERESAGTRFL